MSYQLHQSSALPGQRQYRDPVAGMLSMLAKNHESKCCADLVHATICYDAQNHLEDFDIEKVRRSLLVRL